ncbi:hypothetical protein SANTM175S_06729 [Streptomyces antimycoticus]
MATTPTPLPPTAPPKPSWDPQGASRPNPWLRPTIRIRLTLLYGGMFLIAGVVLLTIIYLLAAQALHVGNELPFKLVGGSVQPTNNTCPEIIGQSSPDQFNAVLNTCMKEQRQLALDGLLRRSLIALLGLSVIAFAFGYAMAGRVLSPLGRITRTARQVAGSDLSRRIELDGPDDELKELADTFDEMLERLDRAFTAQQRFVANASHELRTPLAINRTLLEVQLSDPQASPELVQLGKTLLATNERSEQLVEGLLLLARSDNEIVDRKPVDLAEVASQAMEQVRAEAEGKGVELRGQRAPGGGPGQRSAARADRVEPRPERGAVQHRGGRLGRGHHREPAGSGRAGGGEHRSGGPRLRDGQHFRTLPPAPYRAHRQRQGRRPRAVDRAVGGACPRRQDRGGAARGRRPGDAGGAPGLRPGNPRPGACPGVVRFGRNFRDPPTRGRLCDRSHGRFSGHILCVIVAVDGKPGKSGFSGDRDHGKYTSWRMRVRHSDRVRSRWPSNPITSSGVRLGVD